MDRLRKSLTRRIYGFRSSKRACAFLDMLLIIDDLLESEPTLLTKIEGGPLVRSGHCQVVYSRMRVNL